MKTMVAIPCLDMMHSQFVMSLTGLKLDGDIKFAYAVSSLVYDARNSLARNLRRRPRTLKVLFSQKT